MKEDASPPAPSPLRVEGVFQLRKQDGYSGLNKHTITYRARELRKTATPAEAKLWQALRNRQLGWKFVRQKPKVLDYLDGKSAFITDFYCYALQLVIEVDGGIHETQTEYDRARENLLLQAGFHTIRFTNDEVLDERDRVLEKIQCAANLRAKHLNILISNAPSPRSEGVGGEAIPSFSPGDLP
jgi:very-short-patch-repair endonuclease